MSEMHRLTIVHCVIAAIITPLGLAFASSIVDTSPISRLFFSLLAIVLPVMAAMSVAYRRGYEAGIREFRQSADQQDVKIQSIDLPWRRQDSRPRFRFCPRNPIGTTETSSGLSASLGLAG